MEDSKYVMDKFYEKLNALEDANLKALIIKILDKVAKTGGRRFTTCIPKEVELLNVFKEDKGRSLFQTDYIIKRGYCRVYNLVSEFNFYEDNEKNFVQIRFEPDFVQYLVNNKLQVEPKKIVIKKEFNSDFIQFLKELGIEVSSNISEQKIEMIDKTVIDSYVDRMLNTNIMYIRKKGNKEITVKMPVYNMIDYHS